MSIEENLEIKKYKLLRKERVKRARRKRALYTVVVLAIALVEVIVLI